MRICHSCGAEIPDWQDSCPACGQRQPQQGERGEQEPRDGRDHHQPPDNRDQPSDWRDQPRDSQGQPHDEHVQPRDGQHQPHDQHQPYDQQPSGRQPTERQPHEEQYSRQPRESHDQTQPRKEYERPPPEYEQQPPGYDQQPLASDERPAPYDQQSPGHERPPPGDQATQRQPRPQSTETPEDEGSGLSVGRREAIGAAGLLAFGAGGWWAFLRDDEDIRDEEESSDDGDESGTGDDETADGPDDGNGSNGDEPDDGTGSATDFGRMDIGVAVGLTGGFEDFGPPIRDGALAVADQVNAADAGWNIEMHVEDTEGIPDLGIDAAHRLADDVDALVGGISPEVTRRIAQEVTIPQQLVQITPANADTEYQQLHDQGGWTFQMTPSETLNAQALAETMLDRLSGEQSSILVAEQNPLLERAELFVEQVERRGGEVTGFHPFEPGRFPRDMVHVALDENSDVLAVFAFPYDAIELLRTFYEESDRPDLPVLVTQELGYDGFSSEVDPNDEYDFSNVTGVSPTGGDHGVGEETVREFVGDDIEEWYVREAYDTTAVLCLARAAANTDETAAIRDQIRAVTSPGGYGVQPDSLLEGMELAANGDDVFYEGVSGPVEFGENGSLRVATYHHFGWDSEEIQTLDTFSVDQ